MDDLQTIFKTLDEINPQPRFVVFQNDKVSLLTHSEYMQFNLDYPDKRCSFRVDQSHINGCRVSTVLLPVVHGLDKHRRPIVFETMIFTNRKGRYKALDAANCYRATSVEQARAIHHAVCDLVKRKQITKLRHFYQSDLLSFEHYFE